MQIVIIEPMIYLYIYCETITEAETLYYLKRDLFYVRTKKRKGNT